MMEIAIVMIMKVIKAMMIMMFMVVVLDPSIAKDLLYHNKDHDGNDDNHGDNGNGD